MTSGIIVNKCHHRDSQSKRGCHRNRSTHFLSYVATSTHPKSLFRARKGSTWWLRWFALVMRFLLWGIFVLVVTCFQSISHQRLVVLTSCIEADVNTQKVVNNSNCHSSFRIHDWQVYDTVHFYMTPTSFTVLLANNVKQYAPHHSWIGIVRKVWNFVTRKGYSVAC